MGTRSNRQSMMLSNSFLHVDVIKEIAEDSLPGADSKEESLSRCFRYLLTSAWNFLSAFFMLHYAHSARGVLTSRS